MASVLGMSSKGRGATAPFKRRNVEGRKSDEGEMVTVGVGMEKVAEYAELGVGVVGWDCLAFVLVGVGVELDEGEDLVALRGGGISLDVVGLFETVGLGGRGGSSVAGVGGRR